MRVGPFADLLERDFRRGGLLGASEHVIGTPVLGSLVRMTVEGMVPTWLVPSHVDRRRDHSVGGDAVLALLPRGVLIASKSWQTIVTVPWLWQIEHRYGALELLHSTPFLASTVWVPHGRREQPERLAEIAAQITEQREQSRRLLSAAEREDLASWEAEVVDDAGLQPARDASVDASHHTTDGSMHLDAELWDRLAPTIAAAWRGDARAFAVAITRWFNMDEVEAGRVSTVAACALREQLVATLGPQPTLAEVDEVTAGLLPRWSAVTSRVADFGAVVLRAGIRATLDLSDHATAVDVASLPMRVAALALLLEDSSEELAAILERAVSRSDGLI